MKIVYHMPAPDTIYAQRTIFHGFMRAFADLGHEARVYSPGQDLEALLKTFSPDLFMTNCHFLYRRQLDLNLLARHRAQGMWMLTKLDFWNPLPGIQNARDSVSVRDNRRLVRSITAGLMGDAFFHVVEQGDPRMVGFEEVTGYPYHTIPLAADKALFDSVSVPAFQAEIAYVGTYLPAKRDALDRCVLPLRSRGLRLYGQDWTRAQRLLGRVQRAGQLFNVPYLKRLQRPKYSLRDEGTIYASTQLNLNVHEYHQRLFGGDCNERTFKIPLAGGFQLVDDVACIRKYFREDEVVIAVDQQDWFDKVEHYLNDDESRERIAEAARRRVLQEHTYHNRVRQICKLWQRERPDVGFSFPQVDSSSDREPQ